MVAAGLVFGKDGVWFGIVGFPSEVNDRIAAFAETPGRNLRPMIIVTDNQISMHWLIRTFHGLGRLRPHRYIERIQMGTVTPDHAME